MLKKVLVVCAIATCGAAPVLASVTHSYPYLRRNGALFNVMGYDNVPRAWHVRKDMWSIPYPVIWDAPAKIPAYCPDYKNFCGLPRR